MARRSLPQIVDARIRSTPCPWPGTGSGRSPRTTTRRPPGRSPPRIDTPFPSPTAVVGIGYGHDMPDDATAATGTDEPPSTSTSTLIVPARFCGPRGSANGGYVASRVASHVGVTSAADTAPHGIEPRAV